MTPTLFGQTPDGEDVHRVTISDGNLTASVLSWAALLQDLRLDGHDQPLVLGYDNLHDYLNHSPNFGATAGRFANRIGNAQFSIDGTTYHTDPNFLGKHTLHGGAEGIGKRVWQIEELSKNSVVLLLNDPDGKMGFPGNAIHRCTYTLNEGGVLRIEFQSTCDAPTPINLTHHSYFTLDGADDCLKTELQIEADTYLPVSDELIPHGAPEQVADTPFDFRNFKPIGRDLGENIFYDHNWCVSDKRTSLRKVAEARSTQSGIAMSVVTTEPGLQFYAGHYMNTPVAGLTGKPYGPCAGFALEAQIWPDAPNQPDYPNAILRPGETSNQITEYAFARL